MKSDSKDFIRNLVTKMPVKPTWPTKNSLSVTDKETINVAIQQAVLEEAEQASPDVSPDSFVVSSDRKTLVRAALDNHFKDKNKNMSEVHKLANTYFNEYQWIARNAHKISRVLQTIEDFEKSVNQQ